MQIRQLRLVRAKASAAPAGPPGAVPSGSPPPGAITLEADPEFNPRQFVIFLLQTAADIEHALLVQYLYAAYSIKPATDVTDPATGARSRNPMAAT